MSERDLYLDEIEIEVEKRVKLIESKDYEFVPKMSTGSKIAALVLGVASFVSIIAVYQIYS